MRKIVHVLDTKSILKLFIIGALVVFLAWGLFIMKALLITLLLSSILSLGILPSIDYLEKKKIPRGISVVVMVVLFLVLLITMGFAVFTVALNQIKALITSLPSYIESLTAVPELAPFAEVLQEKTGQFVGNLSQLAVDSTLGAFSGIAIAVSLITMIAYITVEFYHIRDFFLSLLSEKKKILYDGYLKDVEAQLGYWLRGQLTLMLIVGSLSYIGLILLGVDYALALAVMAGLLEFIPYIGPIIATIPAAIVGFGMSPITGIGVIGLYIIIQQIENNIIVPKVMQKAVGLNPVVTLIVVLIGNALFGLLGAIVAVPLTLIFYIIFKKTIVDRQEKNKIDKISE